MITHKTVDGVTYEVAPEESLHDCSGCVAHGQPNSLCAALSYDNGDDEFCYDRSIIWKALDQGSNGITANDIKDAINPDHYKVGGIETIAYLKAKLSPEEFKGYLKGNALKYLSRSDYKHESPLEDFKKALWYINRLVQEA